MQSEPGKGTQFSFALPLKRVYSVLIIDDETMLLDMCRLNLKDAGYEVTTTESGLQGLTLAEEKKPNVILLDMKLSDVSGYELIGRLRSNQKTAHIPILVMSGYAEEIEKIDREKEKLALPWISKPFKNEELLRQIDMLVRGQITR